MLHSCKTIFEAALVAFLLPLVFTPRPADAHRRVLGSYVVEVEGQIARWVQRIDAVDLGAFLRLDADGDGTTDQAELEAARSRIDAYVAERLTWKADDVDCGPPVIESLHVDAPVPHWVDIRGYFTCSQPMGVVELGNQLLFDYNRDYRQLVELSTQDGVVQRMLSVDSPSIRVRVGQTVSQQARSDDESVEPSEQELAQTDPFEQSSTSGLARIGLFIREGVFHIFIGFDHILFVLGLTIAAQNLKKLALIVTSFTLAHSITLALASLEVVHVDIGLAESLIALSVAYVGLENIVREPRHRWLLAFGFGLIHGVGFSAVLRDLVSVSSMSGVERAQLLFGFNVGVEIGQLAIVAAVFPIFAWLRRYRIYRPVVLATSTAIFLAGLYWFIERAF